MDVQCERCKTEYEFDDALVSERGTTVRCTLCDHRFKVRGPEAASNEWAVETAAGPLLRFGTLLDLRDAILAKQVSREDALVRAGAPPRKLGSIAELEAFFPDGSGPTDPTGETSTASLGGDVPVLGARVVVASDPPVRHPRDTLRPPASGSAAPPPALAGLSRMPAPPTPSDAAYEVPRAPARTISEATSTAAAQESSPEPPVPNAEMVAAGATSQVPPPATPFRRARSPSEAELPALRSSPPTSGDFDPLPRRRVGGWIVAVALLLAAGVVGWAAFKPYLLARQTEQASTANPLDARAQAFLGDGENAMRDGDLDHAQETFDKASVLAEKDPRVLFDEARLAAAKADIPWLKLRLLAPDNADDVRLAKAQLDELLVRVRRTSSDARDVRPGDVAAIRVEVDALRLVGALGDARAMVSKMGASSSPETAYILAALDLAEPQPLWATVIERLRLVASGEGNAGRGRAALIYALAKAGDLAGAKAELATLDGLVRPHPLLPTLRSFVNASAAVVEKSHFAPSLPVSATTAHMNAGDASVVPDPTLGGRRPAPPGGGAESRSDARSSMLMASAAVRKGDLTRARQLYEVIVARNPEDSEALAGIGDVARMRGDSAGAVAAYRRAIAVNPSYLPALMGLADTLWTEGDRASATSVYNDIVDHFPEGTYPPYVTKRSMNGPSPASPPHSGAVVGPFETDAQTVAPAPPVHE